MHSIPPAAPPAAPPRSSPPKHDAAGESQAMRRARAAALAPAFEDLRAALAPLTAALAQVRDAVVAITAAERALAGGSAVPGASVLRGAAGALSALDRGLDHSEEGAASVARAIATLERSSVDVEHLPVRDIVDTAVALARRSAAGLLVVWDDAGGALDEAVLASRPVAVLALASTLAGVARAVDASVLHARVTRTELDVEITIAAPTAPAGWLEEHVATVRVLADPAAGVTVEAGAGALVLGLARAAEPPAPPG